MNTNDLHKPNYLDAKMELGTQVQFFSFSLTQLCSYTMVLAFLTILLLNLIPTYYTGSKTSHLVFYLITNIFCLYICLYHLFCLLLLHIN